jgi:selenocysteine lyase/cysteine desulfurase
MNQYDINSIKSQIIGSETVFSSPFGERNIFYADYTASGRGLHFLERKMINIQKSYANSHTEDDYTGKYTTDLLHQAEAKIKQLVNAGPNGKVLAFGSGATGALFKLQQILGIYIPPVTKNNLYCTEGIKVCTSAELKINQIKPVIFISPYEHHSNELMWREAIADVEVIKMDKYGMLDINDLETQLSSPKYDNRRKLASFSAGSNITGLRTPVYEIAKICHRHHVPIIYDFAAIAPYVEIDMNRNEESYFDALFFSPHKFLGGPGTCGILIINDKLYRRDLPPTVAGGGTVDYVGYHHHDFSVDIETREKAGTPPILQTIKTALVMDLKDKIKVSVIEEREHHLAQIFFERTQKIPNFKLIGKVPLESRIPIISFNIRHDDRILHHKFVTHLLNDLFGIQSRAGCSCAGPYGHYLMQIDETLSDDYRLSIIKGYSGIKPGWVRVNLHYTFDDNDLEFLLDAIEFIASYGHLFLTLYSFDINTGEWRHKNFNVEHEVFSINNEFDKKSIDLSQVKAVRQSYFQEAQQLVDQLKKEPQQAYQKNSKEIEAIKFFHYVTPTLGV